MRVMVMVKATADSEAGILPTAECFEAMGNFNQQLVEAGVMTARERDQSKYRRIDGENQ